MASPGRRLRMVQMDDGVVPHFAESTRVSNSMSAQQVVLVGDVAGRSEGSRVGLRTSPTTSTHYRGRGRRCTSSRGSARRSGPPGSGSSTTCRPPRRLLRVPETRSRACEAGARGKGRRTQPRRRPHRRSASPWRSLWCWLVTLLRTLHPPAFRIVLRACGVVRCGAVLCGVVVATAIAKQERVTRSEGSRRSSSW